MRSDLVRALDRRLQDLRCVHWGRGYQLASEEDRLKCIEHVMSLIEPALEMAGLTIKPKTMADKVFDTPYGWQHDRELPGMWEASDLSGGETDNENPVLPASTDGANVDPTDVGRGKDEPNTELFSNGLC